MSFSVWHTVPFWVKTHPLYPASFSLQYSGGKMDFGSRGRSVDRYRRDSRSPRRSRGRRGGSQPPPEPANPPRGWRTPAAPPPSRSEGGRDARVRGGGDSRSRSYLKDRRGLPGLDTKSRPEERPASLSLVLTTGIITAAGAWAARFEVAAMLEARCDPNELVTAIKSGKEGPHVLNMAQHDPGSATRSTSQGSWKPAGSTGNTHDDIPGDLSRMEKTGKRRCQNSRRSWNHCWSLKETACLLGLAGVPLTRQAPSAKDKEEWMLQARPQWGCQLKQRLS